MAACATSSLTAVRFAVPFVVIFSLACAIFARAGDVPPRFVFLLDEPRIEPAPDTLKVLVPGESEAGAESPALTEAPAGRSERHRANAKIVGGSFFGTGVFLCAWGISSWQFKEDQCCPTRNTENILKIIVGVVLVNAGLAYLLGVLD